MRRAKKTWNLTLPIDLYYKKKKNRIKTRENEENSIEFYFTLLRFSSIID